MANGRKTGGRSAGTPNKRTAAIFGTPAEVLDVLGFNPIMRMAEIAADPDTPIELQVKCCAEIAPYLYAKKKPVEVVASVEQVAKVEYGWVARKSSAESNMIPFPASSDSTSVEAGSKASPVQ